MILEEWAKSLLFGTSIEEKLRPISTEPLHDLNDTITCLHPIPSSSIDIPDFPGRPESLKRIGKTEFPSLSRLHHPEERGKVLHFFANHELLALELMSLVLLRFPQAPLSFRQGIAKIIQEEQGHLQLYIARMKELGITLGDIPINDYFCCAPTTFSCWLDRYVTANNLANFHKINF